MIGNCFKHQFACTITYRFLTNQSAHNNSVVLLINWSKIVYCAAKLVLRAFKDHVSYDGCKEKTNFDYIMYSNPHFFERRLAGACNNCL